MKPDLDLLHLAFAPGILDAKGETVSAMKSAFDRLPNPVSLLALMLLALAAPGCVGKANPVLPSTGDPPRGGLVGSRGLDSGADDALLASDVHDVRVADTSSKPDSGICDLVAQTGCQKSLACYPAAGVGRCQDYGPNTANTPCAPSLGSEGQCVPGLACVTTAELGMVCEPLCDVLNPPKGCFPACQPLPGFTTVGYCPP